MVSENDLASAIHQVDQIIDLKSPQHLKEKRPLREKVGMNLIQMLKHDGIVISGNWPCLQSRGGDDAEWAFLVPQKLPERKSLLRRFNGA